jgi:hypothetical protein
MAVMCRACLTSREISLPPVRTRRAPCDFCGSTDDIPVGRSAGMNFDIPEMQIPGNRLDPNEVAAKEKEAQSG